MTCSVDIIPALIRLKFDDHELFLLKDVWDETYDSVMISLGGPVQRISKPWTSVLEKFGLLELINMPHFGHLNEAHACVKKLLACFHGGMIWMTMSIPITVELIASITGLPKGGEDPAQYIHG